MLDSEERGDRRSRYAPLRARTPELSYKELMFEAAVKAYDDAGLDPRRDIERQRVLSVAYRPKVTYKWATGIAIGRFLQELKAGRILGSRCGHCNRIVVPPRVFCEYCFGKVDDWLNLPDTGIVNTYSVSHIAADTTRLKTPIIPAMIEIDSTSNAGFLHILGDMEPEKVKIGMRVKAVWKDPAQRQGSITDIRRGGKSTPAAY